MEMFFLKKKLVKTKNIKKILTKKRVELINLLDIKFEYLELRNILNLKNSNKVKDSKLFFAYYINKVRLIDNVWFIKNKHLPLKMIRNQLHQ